MASTTPTATTYAKTLLDLVDRFQTEADCTEYLARLRWPGWPDVFECRSCGPAKPWVTARGRIVCAGCRRHSSVVAGTLLDGTKVPLRQWIVAAWLVVGQKGGASALSVQRSLGIGQYKTAWMLVHKLRFGMIRPGRDMLQGVVEVDEAYIGGVEEAVSGRETHTKSLVAVAAEIHRRKTTKGVRFQQTGRIRLEVIDSAAAVDLIGFVERNVAKGSSVYTDGLSAYRGLAAAGYQHQIINIKRSGAKAHELLPAVHRAISLLKRRLLGTHQGAASADHLSAYLNEFVFRFNRRNAIHSGLPVETVLRYALHAPPCTYETLVTFAGDESEVPSVLTNMPVIR